MNAAARVVRALAIYREHLTATPARSDGTPYRCECVGCRMGRVLLGEDDMAVPAVEAIKQRLRTFNYPQPITPADTHPTGCIGCKIESGPHVWTAPQATPSGAHPNTTGAP